MVLEGDLVLGALRRHDLVLKRGVLIIRRLGLQLPLVDMPLRGLHFSQRYEVHV